jgi:four helix bundle protein
MVGIWALGFGLWALGFWVSAGAIVAKPAVGLQRAMSRNPRNLRVFVAADTLVLEVYQATVAFPATERYGLRLQLRRAAVSVATNIVEGSARLSTGEYLQFLNVAAGSAAEAAYLSELACRLAFLTGEVSTHLSSRYTKC